MYSSTRCNARTVTNRQCKRPSSYIIQKNDGSVFHLCYQHDKKYIVVSEYDNDEYDNEEYEEEIHETVTKETVTPKKKCNKVLLTIVYMVLIMVLYLMFLHITQNLKMFILRNEKCFKIFN